MMIPKELLSVILEQYSLPIFEVHGVSHWARVLENGRLLAERAGANLEVVELFAVFHDSCRINEGTDPSHGARGAKLASELRGKLFDLPEADFRLLQLACVQHTNGKTQADLTVQVCWDSDRLDLYRVDICPHPDRLCTDAARDPAVIAWANERASTRLVPELVWQEWGLDHKNE
jgi:uncharacterized protein